MHTFAAPPVSVSSASSALGNQPININETAEVDYWVGALGCSELELRMAVAEVGNAACDVGCKLGLAG